MQKTPNDIALIMIVITILLLMMVGFIVTLIFLYRKRQNSYFQNLETLKHDNEKNLLQSQVEVQEQTLQNISREIHDNINLSLTLAKLQLNTLNIEDQNKATKLIDSSVDLLSKSINDLRDLSKSMNADIIVHEGLIDALENETARISKTGFLEITTQIRGNPVFLDAKKELIIFRIVQESFNNIIKHAQANKATLDLYYDNDHMEITIEDNGNGFDTTLINLKAGAGLNNMKTRAKVFNGDVNVESHPGSGTKVLISIPF